MMIASKFYLKLQNADFPTSPISLVFINWNVSIKKNTFLVVCLISLKPPRFLSFYERILFVRVCAYVHVCTCVCRYQWRPEEGVASPGLDW